MNILVTGGAGYIGGHFVNQLRSISGHSIVVADILRESASNVIQDLKIIYRRIDIRDQISLDRLFSEFNFDMVVHFAALASVPDSVVRPAEYYDVNVKGGLVLLETMRKYRVNKIIFSSSAAVYGEPVTDLISEEHPKEPKNPYGYTKLVFENILNDYFKAYGLSSISFRYFCAAGNDESGLLGEFHNPETHIIPVLIENALGIRSGFKVYGNDYNTIDGTGVRDYVHVNDIASAHINAMDFLQNSAPMCRSFNLGTNKGYSVLELIRAVSSVSQKEINYEITSRRIGDPSKLVADASRAKKDLFWEPKYNNILDIINSAYAWRSGYERKKR